MGRANAFRHTMVSALALNLSNSAVVCEEARRDATETNIAPAIVHGERPLSAPGNIRFSRSGITYDVMGQTPAELEAQMKVNGPNNYWAFTDWTITIGHNTAETSAGKCAIENLSVTLNMKVTLPRWANAPGDSDTRRQSWDAMAAALMAHEEGHANNALRAAIAVQKVLANLPPQPSCEAMNTLLNSQKNSVIKAYRDADIAYDSSTNHGARDIPALTW